MKIGIDASRANKIHKTGTEYYSFYLIKELAKIDDKNEYILYTDKPLRGDLSNLTEDKTNNFEKPEYDKKGFQIISSPHNNFKAKILKWSFSFFWTQGRLSIEMLFKRPDILFIPSHALPVIHPKKSLVTIHDIAFERNSALYQKEVIGPGTNFGKRFLNFFVNLMTFGKYSANTLDYLRWSSKYAIKKAERIITISNFTKNDLVDFYDASPDKIKVIYNGFNKDIYKCETKEKTEKVLKKYGVIDDYILYIGRIEKKKNIPTLIEAFAIFRDRNKDLKHKLVLVGDASFGFDETKYTIGEFGLDNEVVMTGWIEEEDVPSFYSGASLFIFPSRYEGFGIPLLQSMNCGVPIAASEVASIPEITDGSAKLFNPEFAYSIATSIEEVLKNQEERDKIVSLGYERVKKFSWEKCARQTLELINNL